MILQFLNQFDRKLGIGKNSSGGVALVNSTDDAQEFYKDAIKGAISDKEKSIMEILLY